MTSMTDEHYPFFVGIICTGITVKNKPSSHIPSYNNFVAVLESVRTIPPVNPTDCSSYKISMGTMQLQLSHTHVAFIGL